LALGNDGAQPGDEGNDGERNTDVVVAGDDSRKFLVTIIKHGKTGARFL
jgi:hypothetical protein